MHAYEKNTLPCLISARSGREGGAVIVLVQVIHCDGLSKRGTTRANVRTTDKAREAEVGRFSLRDAISTPWFAPVSMLSIFGKRDKHSYKMSHESRMSTTVFERCENSIWLFLTCDMWHLTRSKTKNKTFSLADMKFWDSIYASCDTQTFFRMWIKST